MPPKLVNPKPTRPGGKGKAKGKPNKQKRHKLKLKGWLKTAADWARFNAWAKINALPRKIPEPEPIVRESRPLGQLKKRLLVISQPAPKSDVKLTCRLDLSVSKAALKAKPSKRVNELAMFVWKDEEIGKEVPNPITKAALNYKPSPRIEEISKPHFHKIESCHALEISKSALKHKATKREKKMSLAKRAEACPNSLTDDEIARLLTPGGIKRSALAYKITDWMSILALPSYRFLKDRGDPEAKEMKKLLEENEDRGKKVLEEQQKKEEEKSEKDKKKRGKKKAGKDQKGSAGDKKKEKPKKEEKDEEGEKNDDQSTEETEKKNDDQTTEEKEKKKDDQTAEEKEKKKDDQTAEEKEKKKEEEKKAKERKKWRTEPGPCKADLSISKAALNAKASARTEEIAKPHIHISNSCRPDAFGVKKSALGGSASARVSEMAKPTHPLAPVERPPPREKDAYGAPIFPKPIYGKRLPKVKPYKMGECKDKDDKKGEDKKAGKKSSRKLEPVPLFPSIDPCLDPIGAKKQSKARKAAEKKRKADIDRKKKQNKKRNVDEEAKEQENK